MQLRLDRFLTLHLFRPFLKAGAGELPVLMYHSISDTKEKGSAYYHVATSPKMFAQQMAMLRAEGYRAVNLRQGRDWLRRGANQNEKIIAITFDDGFRDFYTDAFPVLQKHAFSATMFLPTAFIQDTPARFKDRECMSWGEVRELHRAGIEFGSHTVNHPKLYELGHDDIRTELEVSKAVIEDKLSAAVTSFAYPYAFPSMDHHFVEELTDLLKRAGYACNVTTRIGRVRAGDDPFTLARLPVNSADDNALLLAKISGAYDWMNWPQDVVKKIKNLKAHGRGHKPPRPCRAL